MIETPVNTGETAIDLAPDPIARARGTDIESVINLLKGQETDPASPADPETESQNQPAEKPKLDLKSVAERLGVDPSELYALTFKASDGSEMSIGEAKDQAKAWKEAESVRAEARKVRADFEADRIRQERELRSLLESIDPASVKPELRAAYDKRQAEYLSREREALLRTVPDWSDPLIMTADRQRMTEAIAEYGFTGNDLDNVTDHRLLRLVRDFAKSQKAAAEAKAPPVKVAAAPRRGPSQTPAQQFGRVKAAVTSGRISPQAAVENLLRGK